MSNGIFAIGASALAAAQAGIATTGHNISNVNTPGYSRQETIQVDRQGRFTGSGFIGEGVDVATIRRVYTDVLAARTRTSQADASSLSTLQTQLSQLDNIFGDASSGLGPALDNFFAGISAVAANPSDLPTRQSALSAAQALVFQFHSLDESLSGLRNSTNTRITGLVGEIDTYATQIAGLNARIVNASGGGTQPPNDLLDQRDHLIDQLTQAVGASVVPQSDGSLNVFLSNGQALVVGVNAQTLVAQPDPADPQNPQIALRAGSGVLPFRSTDVTGGELGGLLKFREQNLWDAQNSLGRMALALGSAFNAQHRQGQELYGAAGGDFFRVPAPAVQANTGNTGNAQLQVTVTDASKIRRVDYRLSYDGANYSFTRLDDGSTQTFASLPQTLLGMQIAVGSGAMAAGDSFLIQPTRYAARDIGLTITSPYQIAAATPIRTAVAAANLGSGTISAGGVDATYPAAPLASPVTITYSQSTGMLTGFPATAPVSVTLNGTTTNYAPGAPVPYTAGATISSFGVQFSISGTLADGDSFAIGPNPGGAGDNRNALLLAGIEHLQILNGPVDLRTAYGQLVTSIGSATQQASVESAAQDKLLTQAQAAQQSVSGVNLDEEAINLQRYQQAYLAASKVISVASTLFDAILDINR